MGATSLVQRARAEWHRFRDDEPGHRFRNYRHRLHLRASRALRAGALVCGVLLVAAGFAMFFLPGPGLLVVLLGLALFGGESRRLSGWLDRVEPWVRAKANAALGWWNRRSLLSRGALIVLAMAVTSVAMRAWWRWFGP
jgi:hypothetical protein